MTRTCRINCACASRPAAVRSVRSCVNCAPGLPGLPEFRSAMGKVNVAKLRYMSRDDFRVLTAVRSTPFFPPSLPFSAARALPLAPSLLGVEQGPRPPRTQPTLGLRKRRSESRVFQKPLSIIFYFPLLEAKALSCPFLLPLSRITFQSLWPGKFL